MPRSTRSADATRLRAWSISTARAVLRWRPLAALLRSRLRLTTAVVVLAVAVAGGVLVAREARESEPVDRLPSGAPVPEAAPEEPDCRQGGLGAPLAPEDDRVLAGVTLDWTTDDVASYTDRLGLAPAVVAASTSFPVSDETWLPVLDVAEEVRAAGAALLLTVEPHAGLASVTAATAEDLATRVRDLDLPVVVRFAPDMNGAWYGWGQDPEQYVPAFRLVGTALHQTAPSALTLWSPSEASGYPYADGLYAAAGTPRAVPLDTDGDGVLTGADDPYGPYYPGDDVVDWVGLTLLGWGAQPPQGDTELPPPGRFASLLDGTATGEPDFHQLYGVDRGKPVAVVETAVLHVPAAEGPSGAEVTRAWAEQVYAPDLPERFPQLAVVAWLEVERDEAEARARVDWSATRDPDEARVVRDVLPEWLVGADSLEVCGSTPS